MAARSSFLKRCWLYGFLWIVSLWSLTGCQSEKPSAKNTATPVSPSVAVYLLAETVTGQDLKLDLRHFKLQAQPILTDADILTYRRLIHEMEITTAAYERINRMKFSVSGAPFIIVVGDERIYGGAFWPIYSSQVFDGVVIPVPLVKGHALRIMLGYPTQSMFTGQDPRNNVRLLRTLDTLGKLK